MLIFRNWTSLHNVNHNVTCVLKRNVSYMYIDFAVFYGIPLGRGL